MVFSISAQLRGKVVTITALVISSEMKRTWPSASNSPVPVPPGGGGGVVGGGVGGRPGVEGAAPPGPPPDAPSRAP